MPEFNYICLLSLHYTSNMYVFDMTVTIYGILTHDHQMFRKHKFVLMQIQQIAMN